MAENPYVNKVEYGSDTLIDLTADTVTPQTLLEGATAHDRSGAPISGAVAVAPPSTTTPAMDGTASVGTETAYARGDHVHPRDTSKQDALTAGTGINISNNVISTTGDSSLFVATYNVTTFSEITAAYQDGKVCIANVPPNTEGVPSGVYILTRCNEFGAVFSRVDEDSPYTPALRNITCYVVNGWVADESDTTPLVEKNVDVFSVREGTTSNELLSNIITDYDAGGYPIIRVWVSSGSYPDDPVNESVVCTVKQGLTPATIFLFGILGDSLITYKVTATDPYPTVVWEKTVTPLAAKQYVDTADAALQAQIDALDEPFRVKNWASSFTVEIPTCTEDISNTSIAKMVFSITGEEGEQYQVVGMIAYEVFDAASGGNRINCWPVCQFTGNGQKELSVRWMCGGTTRKTAKRINAWVLLKHR